MLLYDPVQRVYHEVPAIDIRRGEVEVFSYLPGANFYDAIEEEEDDVMIIEEVIVVTPESRRRLDGVRRRLF